MAQYGISGVWKDGNNVITAYAVHTLNDNSLGKAVKTTKASAIALLEKAENSAITVIWNYTATKWYRGEKVEVVGSFNNKYLRSSPDNKLTDNLGHLINFNYIV